MLIVFNVALLVVGPNILFTPYCINKVNIREKKILFFKDINFLAFPTSVWIKHYIIGTLKMFIFYRYQFLVPYFEFGKLVALVKVVSNSSFCPKISIFQVEFSVIQAYQIEFCYGTFPLTPYL